MSLLVLLGSQVMVPEGMSECVCVCVCVCVCACVCDGKKTKEELGRLRLARTSRFRKCAVQSRDCANCYIAGNYEHKVNNNNNNNNNNVTPLSVG